MTRLARPEWKVGSNARIQGRRASLRRIKSNQIEWWDRDEKVVFSTPLNIKPDRKPPATREILQWVATVTRDDISEKVRCQIEELARQNGIPYSIAEDVYLEEKSA